MMDIYTIGGGEIVYEILNAVARCLNGGQGTLQALLRIGGFSGIIVVYFMMIYGSTMEILKRWALPVLLVTNVMFVPQTTVWVKDTITHFSYKIDHVPYGLAFFASHVSRMGKVLTETIEQNFSLVDDLKYQQSGMLFGSHILEEAKSFKIVNRNFKENMRNFVGQCVKYDIMLNQKYSFDDLRNSPDLWSLVSSQPSKNRGFYWVPTNNKNPASFVTCSKAVELFNKIWATENDRVWRKLGRQFFSGRFLNHAKSTDASKLRIDPALENLLKQDMIRHLKSTASYLGDLSQSAEEVLRQSVMINAIQDSAAENSKAAGNLLSYAESKAIQQQSYTFETIGKLAAKLLPILKAVIEALAYACFIFIIPLCMIPSGYRFLINWAAILIWLQAWPPMYAILNFIMNIAARSSTLAEIGTDGGFTIANVTGVTGANADIRLLAGYLSMSIPFLCIAVVKGVGTFVHLASQITGTSMQAAGSGASEVTSGNFSYGNVSLRNHQFDNASQLQRNFSSSLSAGGHRWDTGGVQITNDASGRSTMTIASSTSPVSFSASHNESEEFRAGYSDSIQRAQTASARLSASETIAQNQTMRLAESLSQMEAHDIAHKYGVGMDKATQIAQDAKILDSYYKGHTYSQGTTAGGHVGLNAHVGTPGSSGGEGGSVGTGEAKRMKASVGRFFGLGVSGGLSGGVNASNAENLGDSHQASTSHDVHETQRSFDNAIMDLSASQRNDHVTQLAKDHSQTLSDMQQYSSEKAYNEQMARHYQTSYNQGSHLTVSQQHNLMDYALEIGTKEKGYSAQEASRMMTSNRPEDKAIVQSWYQTAAGRTNLKPTMPMMKQPGWDRYDNASSLRNDFQNQKRQAASSLRGQEDDMKTREASLGDERQKVQDLVNQRQTATNQTIHKEHETIKSKEGEIKTSVKERGKKGAARSTRDHMDKTLNPFNKKDE